MREFPQRDNTLDPQTMVGELAPERRERIRAYLTARCPGSEEVAAIMLDLAEKHPKQLRVKELFETVEAATLIGAELARHCKLRGTPVLYDLACGHGACWLITE